MVNMKTKTNKGEKMSVMNEVGKTLKLPKKEYRVEIKALFIVDVEANSPEEAKKKVSEYKHIGNSSDDGAFFYEPYDWKNAEVEEN